MCFENVLATMKLEFQESVFEFEKVFYLQNGSLKLVVAKVKNELDVDFFPRDEN
ncbi:hypothetical protein TDB9533_01665 [Thalassocella blandensis]|nr:hypothetical protein TDB9533_01665 [Thalassocella blandensis]